MASFDLEAFVRDPSLDKLDSCRKVDLYVLAEHYDFVVPRTIVKVKLKELIMERLIAECVFNDGEAGAVSSLPYASPTMQDQPGVNPETTVTIEAKPPATLPRFDAFSPFSAHTMSAGDARLKVRLARLQIEAKERERQAEHAFKLEIRKLELAAETEVKKLELEAACNERSSSIPSESISHTSQSSAQFDVSRQITLVPQFRESEVDQYFGAFERIAVSLRWPIEAWPLLIQCKLSGKAQEVVSSLSLEDSMNYDTVKTTVLRAYELVPEAYRQKFRGHRKSPTKTFIEFAREKETLFDRWRIASKAADDSSLRELILLEEFKNSVPERLVTYLNEQKVVTLSQAAVLADEFELTHKTVCFHPREEGRVKSEKPTASGIRPTQSAPFPSRPRSDRECYYCHRVGHVIADCLALKRKSQQSINQPKGVGLIKTVPKSLEVGSDT